MGSSLKRVTMISKRLFLSLFVLGLLLILLFISPLKFLLGHLAISMSPDREIKEHTYDDMLGLFFVGYFLFGICSFLFLFMKALNKKEENSIIFFIVIAEILFISVLSGYKYILTETEFNINNFVNGGQLIVASVLALLTARMQNVKKKHVLFILLFIGFAYLGLDELLEIHEKIGEVVVKPLSSNMHFAGFIGQFHAADDVVTFAYFTAGIIFAFVFIRDFSELFKMNIKFFIFITLGFCFFSCRYLPKNMNVYSWRRL